MALLDLLVTAKLGREADAVWAVEGWKWKEDHLDFPTPTACDGPTRIRCEDQVALTKVQTEFDRFTEKHQTADELPDEVDVRFSELEVEIEQLEAKRQTHDADDIARGGAFVILNHDGAVRIERGFVRPAEEKPLPEEEQSAEASVVGDPEGADDRARQDESEEGAAEQLLAATSWLPALLRTPKVAGAARVELEGNARHLMERAARTECQHQDNAEQNGRPAPAVLMHG